MITIHPVVPNPYTLLSLLPTQAIWPTCSISRTHSSAFTCHQPARPCLPLNGKTQILGETQLAWTRLPQGFKSSPILFGEALAVDLAAFPGETLNCALLQYLEDLLETSPTQGDCWRGTKALLALLSTTGYRCLGKRLRSADRRSSTWGLSSQNGIGCSDMRGSKPICSVPRPNTKKEIREFLRVARFCLIWIRVSLKLPTLCLKPEQGLIRIPREGT